MSAPAATKRGRVERPRPIREGDRVQELSGERARGEVAYITRNGLLRVALDPEPCGFLETEMRELAPWEVRLLGSADTEGRS